MNLSDAPFEILGRNRLPADFSREGRVALIGEAAEALLRGELPHATARVFLAAALSGWLQSGAGVGDLERRFFRVAARRGSHATAAEIWHQIRSSR